MISTYGANGWIDLSFMEDGNYKVIVHYPQFRDFISNLVLEVVQNYNIDGVNLDYIRARGWCTTQYCQNDYNTRYGRSLTADIAANDYDHLGAWSYNAITDIVTQVNSKCTAENPGIKISVCGYLPLDEQRLTSYFAQEGRDGKSWVNANLIDFTLSMEYSCSPDYNTFRKCAGEFTGGANGKAGFITGNYEMVSGQPVSRDAGYTATLLSFSQRMKTGVVACYWYGSLSDTQINAIRNGPFKDTSQPYYK